jgi:ABC-2 type transport system ATP-binding protein
VSLTLALGKKPDLLILDEPMSSLDPVARHEFLEEVVEAASDRTLTVIMSSHVVAELGRVCDYVAVLNQGHLVVSGSVSDIVASNMPKPDSRDRETHGQITDLEQVVLSYLTKGS